MLSELNVVLGGQRKQFNKNTRTLGAGDYAAVKLFFILVRENVNCLSSRPKFDFVARLAREAVRQSCDLIRRTEMTHKIATI